MRPAGQLGARVRREDFLPAVMPLEWRQVRRANEALRAVVEACLRVRARQQLDERPRDARKPADTRREQVRGVRVVAAEQLVAAVPDEQMSRGQLPDPAEDRERRRNRVEREERLERVEIDVAARERTQLGREGEIAAGSAVVERLDPEAVACQDEPAPLRIPERYREHPAQALGKAQAVLLVQMEDHLGVAVRAEHVDGAIELAAQLAVVVDLAVLD